MWGLGRARAGTRAGVSLGDRRKGSTEEMGKQGGGAGLIGVQ